MINSEDEFINKKLISIQILRCLACLMVFIVHLGQRVKFDGILRQLTNIGAYGPMLFFLISGFLAARSLCGKNTTPHKKIEYYKKRIITILPLYYFSILYFFITESLLHYANIIEIPQDIYHLGWLRYIFLLNGFIDSNGYFWGNIGLTWTIPVFCFFYLIAPFTLKKISTCKKAFLAWLIVWIISSAIKTFLLNRFHYKSTVVNNLHVFFFGILLFWIIKNNFSLISCLIFNLLVIPLIITKQYSEMYLNLFSSITILCIYLENSFIIAERYRGIISLIDEYSYSLYLMHGIVFCSLIDRIKNHVLHWQVGIIAIIGTIIATWIGHNFIELPMKRKLSHILKIYQNNSKQKTIS